MTYVILVTYICITDSDGAQHLAEYKILGKEHNQYNVVHVIWKKRLCLFKVISWQKSQYNVVHYDMLYVITFMLITESYVDLGARPLADDFNDVADDKTLAWTPSPPLQPLDPPNPHSSYFA